MVTCKDCICYEILCRDILQEDELKLCDSFKNKADFVELSEVKKVIMDYIFEQTVSKYPSAELCRASRMGAEGVIYALEDAFEEKQTEKKEEG